MLPPTTIRSPPSLDDYIPLAEHQSRTPSTFYGGKPVLHYHTTGAKAVLPASQRGSGLPFFPADSSTQAAPNGGSEAREEELVEQTVDLFVNSENFTIFSPSAEVGISIPYPSIALHAIKRLGPAGTGATPLESVYLQLELGGSSGAGGEEDDAAEPIELTLVPPTSPSPADTDPSATQSETARLFEAISTCSNLHPDPADASDGDDEEGGAYDYSDRVVFESEREGLDGIPGAFRGTGDGGLPPPMPGSSGWITAENVHEYFDEEGNWIGGDGDEDEGISGELGDGAGRVRGRDEVEGEEVNGHDGGEDGESKRPRTD